MSESASVPQTASRGPVGRFVAIGALVGLVGALSLQREYGSFDDPVGWSLPVIAATFCAVLGFVLVLVVKPGPVERRGLVPALMVLLLAAAGLGLEHASGAITDDFVMRHVGLLASGALRGAELGADAWRPVIAPWIFGGTGHALLASTTLYFVARGLGRRVPSTVTLTTLLLSPALAGLLVSALLPVGAVALGTAPAWSGFGGMLVAERHAQRRGAKDGPSWRWWGGVGLGLAMASSVPHAHGGAHALALLVGAALVGLHLRASQGGRLARAWAPAALTVVALATAGASALAVRNALRPPEELTQDFLRIAPRLGDANALNSAAWRLATDDGAQGHELDLAEQLSLRSLELSPETEAYLDTLATLQHRLGRDLEAARTELRAAEKRYSPFFIAQMQRFLRAHRAATGRVLEEDGLREASIGLEGVGWGLVMWWPQGTAPLVLTELEAEDGTRLGSVMLVATSTRTGSARFSMPAELSEHLDAGARLTVTWVRGPDPDWDPGLTYYRFDSEPDTLP